MRGPSGSGPSAKVAPKSWDVNNLWRMGPLRTRYGQRVTGRAARALLPAGTVPFPREALEEAALRMRRHRTSFVALAIVVVIAGCASPPRTTVPPRVDPSGTEPRRAPVERTIDVPTDRGRGLAVVDAARTFLGVPYRYGGDDAGGIDCSGLVVRAYGAVGLDLPRTAAAQAAAGLSVPREDLSAGDLVLFAGSGGGVGHIGIWIGRGRFIHDSTSRGVVEEDLRTQWFADRFVGGRRVLHR